MNATATAPGLFRAALRAAALLLAAWAPAGWAQQPEGPRLAPLDPRQSIAIEIADGRWQSQIASPAQATLLIAADLDRTPLRLLVGQSWKAQRWIRPLLLPLPVSRYPIAVIRYRAWQMEKAAPAFQFFPPQTDPHNPPAPLARVAAVVDGQEQELRVDLSAAGEASVAAIVVQVSCAQEIPASIEITAIRFERGPQSPPPPAIARDPEIRVHVRDAAGQHLPGVRVTVDAERSNWSRSQLTDDQGNARLAPLANEHRRHTVRAVKAGFLSVEIPADAPAGGPVEITLQPAQPLGGIVQNPEQRGLPGAFLRFHSRPDGDPADDANAAGDDRVVCVISNEEGRFLTPPLPDGQALSIQASCAGYRPASTVKVQGEMLAALRGRTAVITLQPTPSPGAPGSPEAAAAAAAAAAATAPAAPAATATGSTTAPAAAGSAPATMPAGGGPAASTGSAAPPAPAAAGQLVHAISGVVLDRQGQPVAGALIALATTDRPAIVEASKVTSCQASSRSDGQGRFRLDARAGDWGLLVRHDGGWARARGKDSAQNLTLTLQPWCTVTGLVLASPGRNGAIRPWPAAPLQIDSGELSDPELPVLIVRQNLTADGAGRFTADRLSAGWTCVQRLSVAPAAAAAPAGDDPKETPAASAAPKQGPRLWVATAADKPAEVQLGGAGCVDLIGQLLAPPAAAPLDLTRSHASLERVVAYPFPPLPEGFFRMSGQERQQWYLDLLASPEGQALARQREEVFRQSFRIDLFIAADGRFHAPAVPPGQYQLRVRVPGREDQEQAALLLRDVEIPAVPPASAPAHAPAPAHSATAPAPATAPAAALDQPRTLDLGPLPLTALHPLAAGDQAPDFQAATLEGKTIALADYRGRFVLLDFWATWCGPCLAELPFLQELYARLGQDPRLQIISLSLDDHAAFPQRFARDHALAWTQCSLGPWEQATAAHLYQVTGIPANFLIGPDGKILAHGLRGQQMIQTVKEALEQAQPDATQPRRPPRPPRAPH